MKRGRPKKAPGRRRSEAIYVPVTPGEKERFDHAVQATGSDSGAALARRFLFAGLATVEQGENYGAAPNGGCSS